MIVVVDDEPELAALIKQTLELDSHHVEAFTSAAGALERCSRAEPELIISDLLMPDMDGYKFHTEYRRRHPCRRTPFVFLSAMADADGVVKALDEGADDFLMKPIDRRILAAKVRALLRRRESETGAIFTGRMEQLSLVQVLQFCEQRGLTGEVEFSSPRGGIALRFDAGQMVDDDRSSAKLAELLDLNDGSFVIHSWPAQFADLSSVEGAPESAGPPSAVPMGKLSGVKVGQRILQLQTEYEPAPCNQIVTLVVFEGRVVKKEISRPGPGAAPARLHELMSDQHERVEKQVRTRLDTIVRRKAGQPPSDNKDKLFEEGLQKWRQRQYSDALSLMERAHHICPDDRILKANLEIMRRKLDQGLGHEASPKDSP